MESMEENNGIIPLIFQQKRSEYYKNQWKLMIFEKTEDLLITID